MRCLKKAGKAKTVAMRGSAGTTGRGDTALMMKTKTGEETNTDQGDMGRKTMDEVKDADQGELRTMKENATSTAHGGTQTIKIVQMVAKNQNAIIPPTMNTTGDGTIANTGGRIKSETTAKHMTAQKRMSVLAAIEAHIDNEASIASHLLTAGS